MNDKEHLARTRAASRFVRNQPLLFAEAAQWVASFQPEPGALGDSSPGENASIAYRTLEEVVRYYRTLLDEQPRAKPETQQDALRIILTSWLLNEATHEPLAGPGSPYDAGGRHKCLMLLPVLKSREFMRLTATFAHDLDPRWHRLVFAAWDSIDDPGYFSSVGDAWTPSAVMVGAKKAAKPGQGVTDAVRRAGESYDWALIHAGHLFADAGTKYPASVFDLVTAPQNGCPAYAGKKSAFSRETWERYVRIYRRWKPPSP